MVGVTRNGLVTTEEVADLLRVHPRTVRRMGIDGRLRRIDIGPRVVRYRREDVEALIGGRDEISVDRLVERVKEWTE